jgi:hypothetical protein
MPTATRERPSRKEYRMAKIAKSALSELIEQLGAARNAAQAAYESYKELKAIEDQVRYQLELELHVTGLKSAKGKDFTATIVERPTVVIKHEASVINWLQHTPNVEADHYVGVKSAEFRTLAQAMLKETGELIPGTEVEVRENLAIKKNKR